MIREVIEAIIISGFALTAAIIDVRTGKIPNKLIIIMLGTWLILTAYAVMKDTGNIYTVIADKLLGFAAGGGIFLMVYFISRNGLGGGDVKFMAAAGLYLGLSSTIPAILYGTLLASLTGLILILLKKITRKDKIPLAPFLFAGITLALISQFIYHTGI